MRLPRYLLIALFLTIISSNAQAYDLKGQVSEFTLDNGMKWLLVRRTEAPVFSGIVMVRVGGMNEVEGKTGLAHMFEHMAFKGSSRIGTTDYEKEKPLLDEIERTGAKLTEGRKRAKPDKAEAEKLAKELARLEKEADAYRIKNEVAELLIRNGGADLNAYTSKDVTAYHSSMPSTKLELWARVTAEMVFEPAYREFYIERDVVADERRSNVENDPDGALSEALVAAAYASGPYHWSTIGLSADILGLTIADARAFHEKYYVPANMVGVLVGDFKIADAKGIISRAFGQYENKPSPAAPSTSGKAQGGLTKRIAFDAEPSVAIAYHKPTLPDPSEYVFDFILTLLCDGRSSRLEKRLIYEKKLARDVGCSDSYPGSKLANLFTIWAEPLKGRAASQILAEVSHEIERLKNKPIDDEELTRVRKNAKANMIFGLESNEGLAHQLAEFQALFGDWTLLADYTKNIDAVTADDVMRVAKKYFAQPNGVVIERIKGKR